MNSAHSLSTFSGGINVSANARSSKLMRASFNNLDPLLLSFFPKTSVWKASFFPSRSQGISAISGGIPVETCGIPVELVERNFAVRLRSRSHARRFSSVRYPGLSTGFTPDNPVDMDRTNSINSAVCDWLRPLAINSLVITAASLTDHTPRRKLFERTRPRPCGSVNR